MNGHRASCILRGSLGGFMEPIGMHALVFADQGRGSRSWIKIADTKHFKNRVYSSRTVDVFSGLINATR